MLLKKIDVNLEFNTLWNQIEERKLLPFDILDTIPDAITEGTKKQLTRKSPEKIVRIIRSAIDEINAGSVESIDTLVGKAL